MAIWTELQARFLDLWADSRIRAALIVSGSILAAYLVDVIISRAIKAVTRRSRTELDDQVVSALHRPIFLTVLFAGLAWATTILITGTALFVSHAILKTLAVLTWSLAIFRIGVIVIDGLSTRASERSVIQPRTVPFFDMMIKIGVIGAAIYFTLLSWQVDVTAWLASAGIAGIAIGFAAKDSLANVIAGLFILADSPYKVGDFIVLENTLRGQVTRIGLRSTRIITLDDVEIIVPNAVIGNGKIVNEVGGPNVRQRVHIDVPVAYSSDVDRVSEVLLGCSEGIPELCEYPPPEVRLHSFADARLNFKLLVWITDAAARDRVIARINLLVFKRFQEAGIEIPHGKQDLYVKELPDAAKSSPDGRKDGRKGSRGRRASQA